MRAISSAKASWRVTKEADVAAKVRTAVIMARKSQVGIRIVSIGVTEVLGQAESIGTEGIGGSNDACSGSMVMGTMDAGMWGSSGRDAGGGWFSIGSLSGGGGAFDTNYHFSTLKISSQTRRRAKWGSSRKPRFSNT